MISRILKTKAVVFLLLKYLAFAIQLVNSVLIAKYLGAYYFGLYGFVLLICQYLSFANFGVQYSYSVLCSDVSTRDGNQRLDIISTALSLLICVSVFLIIIYLSTFSIDLFPKYHFTDYFIYVVLIAIVQYFNMFFVNVFRLNGKINELNFYYLIVPLCQLFPLFFFEENSLFFALLLATIGSNIISFLVFLVRFPISIFSLQLFRFQNVGLILKRGLFLLLYNFTFYGILLVARTIVSRNFEVTEFALFNFSNSISTAVFLLLGSLNFLFYPKLINAISSKKDNEDLIAFILKIREYYLTLTLLIVLISLFSLPVLFYFLPQYAGAAISLQILLLAQLIVNNSFGYSTLLVQKGKEFQMTICAGFAIVLIVFVSWIGLKFFNSIEMVATAVLFGVLVYNVLIGYLGSKMLSQYSGYISFIVGMFEPSLFFPIIVCVTLMVFSDFYLLNVLAVLFLYIAINYKQLISVFKGGVHILSGKDLFSIK